MIGHLTRMRAVTAAALTILHVVVLVTSVLHARVDAQPLAHMVQVDAESSSSGSAYDHQHCPVCLGLLSHLRPADPSHTAVAGTELRLPSLGHSSTTRVSATHSGAGGSRAPPIL
jgi:hypothetical protein